MISILIGSQPVNTERYWTGVINGQTTSNDTNAMTLSGVTH